MKAVMFGAMGNSDLVELRETLFEKELDLQQFLSKHPALLAGDQMNPTDPRRFVLITAEAGIAIAQDGADYFSLDHLFIDQDGIPTLVEVKRSTDTRLRREVVGQMLEYAANACAHWDIARLKSVFERRCKEAQINAQDQLDLLSMGLEGGTDLIWEKVAQNLKLERLRLIFIADQFLPETQRIIEFLNRQMQLSEVYAVEVRQYTGSGMKTLVPRVLNPSLLQADRRAAATGRGSEWSAERFYGDLRQRRGEEAVNAFRKIHEWASSQVKIGIFFGRGKSDGSLQIAYKHGDDQSVYQSGDTVILTLWTSGRAEIEFQYLSARYAFASQSAREELWRRLTSGSTLKIAADRIALRPSVSWSELVDDSNLSSLLDAMSWVIATFDGAGDSPDGQQ